MADLLGYPTHASHITEVKAVHSCALGGDFFLDISKDSKLMMGMDLLFIVLWRYNKYFLCVILVADG